MRKHAHTSQGVDFTDIRPLSEFQRNAKAMLRELRQTGRPMLLTVNGRAAAYIRDASHQQAALDELNAQRLVESLRRGAESVKRGGGRPLDEVYAEIKARHFGKQAKPRRKVRKAA